MITEDDAHTLVHQYSEWLDGQGLMVPESDGDPRSHEDLVAEFLRDRSELALPVVQP